MENKVLEENLEIIKKYDRNLFNKILMFENEKSNLSVSQTQKGEYNLVYKGYCLHNQQGAIDEAKDIASKIEEEKNSIRVIYGLGLGYVVDEIAGKIKNSKIIIYEPEIEIIKYVLSIAKIDALFKQNVVLCSDKETLARYVTENTDKDSKMKLIYTKSYKQLFEDDLKQVLQTIQKAQGQHCANVNTIITKAPSVLLNTYSNLDKILNLPYIMQYKDIYKNKTALIISAGPSLRDNIEIIKQNKDKFVIFCVNAAMEYVVKSGIEPDFIVDIETFGSNIQYKDIDISNSYLILETFSSFNKYKVNAKQLITYISKNNFINGWIRKCLQIEDELETMGTVSYTALNSAYIMGFDKIILIGQDLAFKNGQCYAKGSRYEDLECVFDENVKKYIIKTHDIDLYTTKLTGKNTPEAKKIATDYIESLNKNIYTIKGQDGSYLPTQTGYAIFVEWFERAALNYKNEKPQIKLINASVGGAQINGFENINLVDALKDSEPIEKIELSKEKINFDKEICKKQIEEHLDGVLKYVELAKEVKKYCEKFLNELKTKKILTQNALKYMKKHNDALNKLLDYNKNQSWSFFMVRYAYMIIPVIERDFSKDLSLTKQTFEELLEIYNKLFVSCDFYIKKLTNCQAAVL